MLALSRTRHLLRPLGLPDVARHVVLERLDLGTLGERRDELAAAEDRIAVSRVDRREVEREDVAVLG